MKWFYGILVALGLATVVLLALPGITALGFYLLVLPGLVLVVIPTLFQWVASITAVWVVLHGLLGNTKALVAAVLATTALFYAIPTPARWAAQGRLDAHHRPDLIPSEPLELFGDIRVHRMQSLWDNDPTAKQGHIRPYACDELCVQLLQQPRVRSVTIHRSNAVPLVDGELTLAPFNASSRTYRLLASDACEGQAVVQPTPKGLAPDLCVVRQAPLTQHDLVFIEANFDVGAEPGKRFVKRRAWSLLPSAERLRTFEARDGEGAVLARVRRVSVWTLKRPMHVGFYMNGSSAWYGWALRELSDSDGRDAPLTLSEGLGAVGAMSSGR